MTNSLIQLAPGAYDLLLNGQVMGSVVRAGHRSPNTTWTAELLEDLPPDQETGSIQKDRARLRDPGGGMCLARQSARAEQLWAQFDGSLISDRAVQGGLIIPNEDAWDGNCTRHPG
jgi:hypothetical protein